MKPKPSSFLVMSVGAIRISVSGKRWFAGKQDVLGRLLHVRPSGVEFLPNSLIWVDNYDGHD